MNIQQTQSLKHSLKNLRETQKGERDRQRKKDKERMKAIERERERERERDRAPVILSLVLEVCTVRGAPKTTVCLDWR